MDLHQDQPGTNTLLHDKALFIPRYYGNNTYYFDQIGISLMIIAFRYIKNILMTNFVTMKYSVDVTHIY